MFSDTIIIILTKKSHGTNSVGMSYIGTTTGVDTKNYSKSCKLEHLLFICPFIASNYQNFETNNATLPID